MGITYARLGLVLVGFFPSVMRSDEDVITSSFRSCEHLSSRCSTGRVDEAYASGAVDFEFDSNWSQIKDFKIGIRSFPILDAQH